MNELTETTNLILIIGFTIVTFFIWSLINICSSINEKLKDFHYVKISLNDLNVRLRRKGIFVDEDEKNHSQFMD